MRIRRLFGENTVFQASVLISFFILVARLLGLVRDRLFAIQFGASPELDTFFAAFRLPDLIFNLVIIGSFSAAFIPVFIEVRNREGKEKAWDLVTQLLHLLILLWVAGAGLVFVFAPYFVKLITPGFTGETLQRTIYLTRLLLLSPLLLGLSNLAGSTLNAYKRFFLTALAPSLYNLGIILGAVFLAPKLRVEGLAWGVILGAFFHFFIQWIGLLDLGYRYQLRWQLFGNRVKEVIKFAVPRVLATSIYQLNLWVQTAGASFMLGGAISALNFAQNIQSLPVGLVGVALSSAIFPTLTEIALYGRKEEMVQKISKALRMILFIVIPLSLFLILLRAQAVRIILGAGHFDWQDTEITARLVGYFAISLFAQCFVLLLNQAFFAQKDTLTPLKASFFTFLLNAFLIWFFIAPISFLPRLGPEGIALAFSLSSFFQAGYLFVCLKRRLQTSFSVASFGLKVLSLSLFAGVFVQLTKTFLGEWLDLSLGINVLLQGGVAFLVGVGVYGFVGYLFGFKELKEFAKIKNKLF
ncbi:murein biosynthesis integral membrane protein MurJ [bacterium]|nr:murein biosynthesis integral membrane protein MurJ [bacterium]